MSENYLVHHGIEGQKWGVRRYQNPDGSLTPEGLRRYNDTRNGGHLGKGLLGKMFSPKVTKGYKNMEEDGLIKKIQNDHYGDKDFLNTEEGKRLKKEYEKAYEDYFNSPDDDPIKEKKFSKAEENYLKAEYSFKGKQMVDKYGSELVSLYLSEGHKISKDNQAVINEILQEWDSHRV